MHPWSHWHAHLHGTKGPHLGHLCLNCSIAHTHCAEELNQLHVGIFLLTVWQSGLFVPRFLSRTHCKTHSQGHNFMHHALTPASNPVSSTFRRQRDSFFLNPQEDPSELGLLPDSTTTPFLANAPLRKLLAQAVLTILDWGKNVALMIVDTALYLWPKPVCGSTYSSHSFAGQLAQTGSLIMCLQGTLIHWYIHHSSMQIFTTSSSWSCFPKAICCSSSWELLGNLYAWP